MPVSEDGVPYGSIDINELDSVKPKTDEAKDALEGLKARIQEGQDQANADAERLAEAAAAQDATATDVVKDNRDAQGKPVAQPAADEKADDKKASQSHGTTSKKE